MRFTKVSIIEDDESLGRVTRSKSEYEDWQPDIEIYTNPRKTTKRIEKEIIYSFAGNVAEGLYTGRHNWIRAYKDNLDSTNLITYIVGSSQEANAHIKLLWERTKEMLSDPQNWAAVQALVKVLLEENEIGYRRARKIISESLQSH